MAKNRTQIFTKVNVATSANNKPNYTASLYAIKTTFARITTDAKIPNVARFAGNNQNAMSRAIYTHHLVRER